MKWVGLLLKTELEMETKQKSEGLKGTPEKQDEKG